MIRKAGVERSIVLFAFLLASSLFSQPFSPSNVTELINDINSANSNGEDDFIDLSNGPFILCAVNNTTDAPNGLPEIIFDNDTTITFANGTIERGAECEDKFRIMHIASLGRVSLENAAINNGELESGEGGGIKNEGTLSISGSLLDGNKIGSNDIGQGAGVYNAGDLDVEYSIFSNNINSSESSGGGIYNSVFAQSFEVTSSAFVDNEAGIGGGIGDFDVSNTYVNNTFSGNKALRGDGLGGGLYLVDGTGTDVINNTFSENRAFAGGGLFADELVLTIEDNFRTLALGNLSNNIIAGNFADENPDIANASAVNSSSFNIIGIDVPTDPGAHPIVNGVNGNKVGTEANPIDPKLAPLADNGGVTLTYRLLPGSPAIDMSPPQSGFDQRGPFFKRTVNDETDIGSFECQCALCAVNCINLVSVTTVQELRDAICAANESAIPTVIDLGGREFTFFDEYSCPLLASDVKPLIDRPLEPPVRTSEEIAGALPTIFAEDVTIQNGSLKASPLTLERSSVDAKKIPLGLRLLSVAASGGLTLEDVVVTGGNANGVSSPPDGGGVHLAGRLVIRNSTFVRNSAERSGGAVAPMDGSLLTIEGSTFTDNTAQRGGAIGGAVGSDGLNIFAVRLLSKIFITNTTFSRNLSGIFTTAFRTSQLVDNNGGAISNAGDLEIAFSTFDNNSAVDSGGAIYNEPIATDLRIKSSTFFQNSANNGGAVANSGPSSIIANSTFSDNRAMTGKGGGLYNAAIITNLINNTFTLNQALMGGGIFNDGIITNFISNIVAKNIASRNTDIENAGLISSATNNLIGEDDVTDPGNHTIVDGNNNNQVGNPSAPIDPGLNSLSDNGGPTLTHALQNSSPARDAGRNPELLPFDQRGPNFFRTGGRETDIGAFEIQVRRRGRSSGGGGSSFFPGLGLLPNSINSFLPPPINGFPLPPSLDDDSDVENALLLPPAESKASSENLLGNRSSSAEKGSGCSSAPVFEPLLLLVAMLLFVVSRRRYARAKR